MAGHPARVNARVDRGPPARGRDGGGPARGQAGAHPAPARDIEWNGQGPGTVRRHPGVRVGRRGPGRISPAPMARRLHFGAVRSVALPGAPADSGATRDRREAPSGPRADRHDQVLHTGPPGPCHSRVGTGSDGPGPRPPRGSTYRSRRPSSSDPRKNSSPAAAQSRRPSPPGARHSACWSPRSAAMRSNRSSCMPPRCESRSSRSRVEP